MILMEASLTSLESAVPQVPSCVLVGASQISPRAIKASAKKERFGALCASFALHAVVLGILACCGWQVAKSPRLFDVVVDTAVEDFESVALTSLDLSKLDTITPPVGEITYGIPGGRSGGGSAFKAMGGLVAPSAALIGVPTSRDGLLANVLNEGWGGNNHLADKHEMVATGSNRMRGNGSGSGTGTGNGVGDGYATEFFGLAPLGKRIVYVMDASKSMNRPHDSDAQTRFKRVKIELVNSIGSLPQESQFFIIFFNDYCVSMPAPGLEPATLGAKQKYLAWMQQVITAGNTEPTMALATALKMRPDIIYFLSDGDFNARVRSELMELPVGDTKVQTVAFAEPMTDAGRDAFDLIEDGKIAAAQKLVPSKDYRRIAMAWRGQKFLRELSERHNGKLVLVQ